MCKEEEEELDRTEGWRRRGSNLTWGVALIHSLLLIEAQGAEYGPRQDIGRNQFFCHIFVGFKGAPQGQISFHVLLQSAACVIAKDIMERINNSRTDENLLAEQKKKKRMLRTKMFPPPLLLLLLQRIETM